MGLSGCSQRAHKLEFYTSSADRAATSAPRASKQPPAGQASLLSGAAAVTLWVLKHNTRFLETKLMAFIRQSADRRAAAEGGKRRQNFSDGSRDCAIVDACTSFHARVPQSLRFDAQEQ